MKFFNRTPEPDPDDQVSVTITPPDADGKRRFTLTPPQETPVPDQQTPDDAFDGGSALTEDQYAARKAWQMDPAALADETPTAQQAAVNDPTVQRFVNAPGEVRRRIRDLEAADLAPSEHEHEQGPAITGTQLTITPEDICPNCGQRMPSDAALLQAGVDLLTGAQVTDQLTVRFYEIVFELAPEARALFDDPDAGKSWQELVDVNAPTDSWGRNQRDKIVSSIALLAKHYGDTEETSDDPDFLDRALVSMGRAHSRFNLTVEHYGIVGTALLRALQEFAGDAWTPAMEAAWTRAYKYMAGTMLRGEATPNRGQTGRRRRV